MKKKVWIRVEENNPMRTQYPFTGTDEIGIYIIADRLSKKTEYSRIEWLQKIANAIITNKLQLSIVALRKTESQGLEILDPLAHKEFNHEPKDLESCLSTVRIETSQIEDWLLMEYNMPINQNEKGPRRKDELRQRYKRYAEKLHSEGKNRKQIIIGILLKFSEAEITDREISIAMGESGTDNERSSVNKITRVLRKQSREQK